MAPRDPSPSLGTSGPQRTCVGCRRQASQEELIRVTRTSDGGLRVGRSAPGRGAWLCRGSEPCLDRAIRRRAFDRALRGTVRADALELLRRHLG